MINSSLFLYQNSIQFSDSSKMNKEIVAASRIVQLQQIKRKWIKHEERLINIKPTINTRNTTNKIGFFKKHNITQIFDMELQNKSLLKKLTQRSQSKLDASICSSRPLIRNNRKKYYEEYKIKMQNIGLYKRLKETKPMYNTEKLQFERKTTEKLINTISRFGFKDLKPNKTVTKFDMKNNDLKYLSRRKIILNRIEDQKQYCEPPHLKSTVSNNSPNLSQNGRLLALRIIEINQKSVFLSMKQINNEIHLKLTSSQNKQNNQSEQFQAVIDKETYKNKYQSSLSRLIDNFRYDDKTDTFYIL